MRGRAARLPWVALLVAACSGERGPEWVDLARAPLQLQETESELWERAQGPGEDERWLAARIARAEWRAGAAPGRFTVALPVLAAGSPRAGGAPYRLEAEGRAFSYRADPASLGGTPGEFTTTSARGPTLELVLESGAEPPASAELCAVVRVEGLQSGARHVSGRRFSGAGFFAPAGRSVRVACALPPGSSLRFATAVEPLQGAREPRCAAHTFRVTLDGAVVFERRVEPDVLGEAFLWHEVALPRGGVRRATLAFEVAGPLALTSFLAPSVGPSAPGSYGARPWDAGARPDLVVFLADTFRADNLAAYGSACGVTPELDRFAAGARVFARAWSTSTHTLPAHSSMFSGVFPHQNGQVDYENPLPFEVETLAERLSAHGYRCGAVTDGVMVSRSHGLEQGFASFDERRETETLARVRAFLDADDGRPVFLFVQTYGAHTPYTASAETRARLAGTLRLERGYEEVMREAEALGVGPEDAPADPARAEVGARLHDLYRGAVAEVDALFGRFRAELEARGLAARGYLVFTSDHGEAFFEHGRPFHAGPVFEEELRVPLIVQGPLAAPGVEARPVSLIDFAPTLAGLARLAPSPEWRGADWLAPPPERVLFAFQARRRASGRGSTLAVIDGTRKLIGYEDPEAVRAGRLRAAFDLERDPQERTNLLAREAWPAELARAQRAELERLLTPLVTQTSTSLSGEEVEELRAMGYAGEQAK